MGSRINRPRLGGIGPTLEELRGIEGELPKENCGRSATLRETPRARRSGAVY